MKKKAKKWSENFSHYVTGRDEKKRNKKKKISRYFPSTRGKKCVVEVDLVESGVFFLKKKCIFEYIFVAPPIIYFSFLCVTKIS